MKEETKPCKEEKEGKLKQKREKSSDLEDTPPFHACISIEVNLKLFFGVVLVSCQIFMEPLFNEDPKGCGDEGDDKAERP